MPDNRSLVDVWQRAIEANIRYYESVARLTTEYLQDLVSAVGEAGISVPIRIPQQTSIERPSRSATPQRSTLVLEAEAGSPAQGAFVAENRRGERISAPLASAPFVDDQGREAHPKLRFDPEVVTLEPGEQVLVRVEALIDESLDTGVTYRGEVSIPGLPGGGVMLGVRRRKATTSSSRRARGSRAKKAKGRPRSSSTPQRRSAARRRSS